MLGFMPFFNKRRDFIKQSLGLLALSMINPFKLFANTKIKENNMIQIQKKAEQFNTTIFNGNFLVNKPVASGTKLSVKPYSNLFYWSHAVAIDDCEFGLHPHEGFEIMTFIIEGQVTHYDTASKVWTPLETGDFQVIQSNKGIQHQERITKGTRSFQIWFDPSFYDAVKLTPSYIDYHSKDFKSVEIDGIKTVSYIGEDSSTKALTPNLTIKKLTFDNQTKKEIALNASMSYTFYVLNGKGLAAHQAIEKDDAIRISNTTNLQIDFQGELFYIETPTEIEYKPIWK
jgi:redox-sensitive bicupin YhaK (pirin superfamily)